MIEPIAVRTSAAQSSPPLRVSRIDCIRKPRPVSVMMPMIDATDNTPPATYTPATPPISASGRFSITIHASRVLRNARYNSTKIPTITTTPVINNVRDASAAASNCPPYSTR